MSESTFPGHEKATINVEQAAKFLVDQWALSGFDVGSSSAQLIKALIPHASVKDLASALSAPDPDSAPAAAAVKPPLHDAAHAASSLLLSPRPDTTAAPVAVIQPGVKRTVCKFCGKVHIENSRCA